MPPKKSEKALKKAFQKSHQAIDDRHAKSSTWTSISGTGTKGNVQVTSGSVIAAPEPPIKKPRIQIDSTIASESASPSTSMENENSSAEATAAAKPYVNSVQ